MTFSELHQQNKPLLMCNVWDVTSTKLSEKLGFQAIGTSSAAIAATLGYEDGKEMSFNELCYIVKRILANTSLPVSVDLESGYSRHPDDIVAHICALAKLGVVGINIEDSIVYQKRSLINANDFATLLLAIKKQLVAKNVEVFLNVRTDTFLLATDNVLDETKERLQLYTEAGANGLFLPGIEKEADIKAIVQISTLPINVMCMPNLADFKQLQLLGVNRISMGNFVFNNMLNSLEQSLNSIIKDQSFKAIF